MIILATRFGNNVHHATGGRAVLGGEGILQNRHFLHRCLRHITKMVWRPQLSLPVLPSTVQAVCRRPDPLVVKRFWFMNTSPWLMAGRLAAFNNGR